MVKRWLVVLLLPLLIASAQAAGVELIYERGEKGTDLQVQLQVTEGPVYERGQALVLYQIETRQPALHLRYGELEVEQAMTYRVPLSSKPMADNRYRHTFGWTVHPLKSGAYTITLPDVAYFRGGNINYRIKGQTIRLQVKRVPDYIPRHLPIGRYAIEVRSPAFWLLCGSEVYFDLFITTNGVADSINRPAPPVFLQAYQSQQPIQLQSFDKTLDQDGLHTRYHYLVPIKISESGLLNVKTKLQWFEPQLQKLQSDVYQAPRVILLNGWQLFVVAVIALALLAYLVKKGFGLLRLHSRRRYGYCRIQKQIAGLDSPRQLRRVLAAIAQAETLPQNMPVSQLLEKIARQWPTGQREALIESVNSALYGDGKMTGAVANLQGLVRARMGLMAFLCGNKGI